MTIYTLGYSGWRMEQIQAELDRLAAILVDVRFSPRSRFAGWNASAFKATLGDRYVWLREFGNENYKGTFDQIKLADFPAGKLAVEALGRPIILMCGCKDVNTCHRKVVAERLAAAWNAEVVHLTPPPPAPMLF